MSSSTLTLTKWDAAIVLKKDGSFEASLPQIQGEYIPENVVLGAAIAFALRNENLCTLIRENFERECCTKKGEQFMTYFLQLKKLKA